ncbi:MAG: SH3 domain-containing protein [bacterium]|nr:SH3 domain-containing protein [bacterium]
MIKSIISSIIILNSLTFASELLDVQKKLEQNDVILAYQKLNEMSTFSNLSSYWQLKAIAIWKIYGMDSLGTCLLASEKAYRLHPTKELKQQLAWFEAKITEPVEAIETFKAFLVIHDFIIKIPTFFYFIGMVLSTLFLTIIFIPVLSSRIPMKMKTWKTTTMIISMLTLSLSSSGSILRYQWSKELIGYTIQSGVTLYQKPSISEKEITTLSNGIKLKKLSEFGNWIEVAIPDGRKGWIQSNGAIFL